LGRYPVRGERRAGAVGIWDAATGRALDTLTGHTALVTSIAFGPDSKTLTSASCDDTVRLWEVDTGRVIHILRGHSQYVNAVDLSPDEKQVASGSGWMRPSDGKLFGE